MGDFFQAALGGENYALWFLERTTPTTKGACLAYP